MRPPGDSPWWPSVSDVIEIHIRMCERERMPSQVADYTQSAISGCIMRALNRSHYESSTDVCALGARLCVDIANRHCFADGNKRTAGTVLTVYLRQNGYVLRHRHRHEIGALIVESVVKSQSSYSGDSQEVLDRLIALVRNSVERLGPPPKTRMPR